MLACGAMHMRAMSNYVSTPKTPFHYYSDAVAAVSRTLRGELGAHGEYNALGTYNDSFDALVISIILLYIYGTWTAADIRSNEDRCHHVRGATQLLKMRYCQTTDPFPLRPIDRVIIESVLCQHFLLTARHPFFPNAFVDTEFWASMESVLGGATCSADFSTANRPILGVLIPLCRLILTIVQLNRSPLRGDAATLTATKQEMAYWEASIEETQFENTHAMGIYNALVVEYVLAASLMLDWIVDAAPSQEAHPFNIPYGESWQLRRAIDVLKRMVYKDKWTRCYLGMWPLQILGYAVDAEGDIALIREDLDRRGHVTGMGEARMVRSELEALWRTRKDSAGGLGAASME
ncbi:unnamed protein product [Clonostachys byssicola]|uniref:Uncharacterized protein n=1 Tax=Clonostachys byssicola TaxID=160290 RepID=A0A9N9TY87_9HYPO|nr:unnamed protein product [Clonostachys byssicola]